MTIVSREQKRDVAGQILGAAHRLGLRSGNRLPTERELAATLELSRTTIRNAMDLLDREGAVSREVGRGTFLRRDPETRAAREAGAELPSLVVDVSPAEVMSARLLIEPAALIAVVENATKGDFDEIERCLLNGEHAREFDEFEHWDLELHQAIVHASHNTLITNMYYFIAEARTNVAWGDLKRRTDSLERRTASASQHREIAEALFRRDGRGARDAMLRHLKMVEANLQISAQY